MDFLNPKTILVVQIGKIGDMILTTPLFSELKKLFPEAALKVLASELNKDIPLNHNSVNETIIYKKNILNNIFRPNSSLLNIHLWIDTKDGYSRTSAFLVKLLKPGLSLGFNFDKKVFNIPLIDHVKGMHSVDINLSPMNYLKNEKSRIEIKPSFSIPDVIIKKFENHIPSGQLNVLINISAGNESRYLENEKWINIINNISLIKLCSITLTGLHDDRERIDNIILKAAGHNVRYVETENILEVSELVRRSEIVITPDTSIVHICSSFNTPVLGLYPNVKWNLDRFKPLSDLNEIIISKDERSIHDIDTEEILYGYRSLLDKIKSGNAESRTRVRKEDH